MKSSSSVHDQDIFDQVKEAAVKRILLVEFSTPPAVAATAQQTACSLLTARRRLIPVAPVLRNQKQFGGKNTI